MRIMCLNGWGGAMHDALLPYLSVEAPEVLCLQEVVHTPQSRKAELIYRDEARELVQRANFFAEVCAALPDHWAMFCPAAEGVLWDGAATVPSQWGLATFVHKSLPVIGQVQGFVHKDYSPDGYGEHPRSRSAHGVRVHDAQGGQTLSILHMHGLRDPAGKMDTEARAAQARRFVGLLDDLSQPGDLRVACGDFNVEPESVTLSLLAQAGLHELVTGREHEGTRTSPYEKPGRFADYMAVDDGLKDNAFEVVRDPEVSDHCPLLLEA